MKDILETDFFDLEFEFVERPSSAVDPGPPSKPIWKEWGIAACLAMATTAITGISSSADLVDLVAFRDVVTNVNTAGGQSVAANPLDGVQAGKKALGKARRVVGMAEAAGLKPDRVTSVEGGAVALYWFAKERTSGGGAAKYAMFECDKDGMGVTLSNHLTRKVEVFDSSPDKVNESINRIRTFLA